MARRRPKKKSSRQHAPAQSPEPERAAGRGKIIGALVVVILGAALAAYYFGRSEGGRNLAPAIAVSPGSATGYRVVLFTLDTLRADHVGCYGYKGVETPVLDALAAGGVRFTDVACAAPITLPSHATILTGDYPPVHGVRDNGTFRLAPRHETLAERLQAEGYATAAFIAAFVLDSRYGLDQGFDVYDDEIAPKYRKPGILDASPQRPADAVIDSAEQWLEEHQRSKPDQPFFLWIHLFDAHSPYDPPEPFKTRYAANRYDGEIAYVDQQVGRFLEELRSLKLMDKTLVVVVGDHGEGLGDHSEHQHSMLIYESTMAVPLIFHGPGLIPGGRVVDDRVVATVDVAPTILDLLGLPLGQHDGVSLLRSTTDSDRAVYIETLAPKLNHGWSALYGLRRRGDKYIDAPRPEYYDLIADPGELNNLWKKDANEVVELADRLASVIESFPAAGETGAEVVAITAEAIEKLAALGYVRGGTVSNSGPPADPKDMIAYWEGQIVKANRLVDQRRYEEAIPFLRKLVRDRPEDPGAWSLLSIAEAHSGLIDDAIHSRTQASQLQPRDVHHWVFLARLQRTKGDTAAARLMLSLAEEVEPQHGQIFLIRGMLDLAAGQHQDALAQCEEARRRDPNNHIAKSWSLQGRILEAMDELPGAESAYTKAYDVNPRDSGALLGLAGLARRAGRFERAVELALSIPRGAPEWIESRWPLYQAYVGLKQGAKAVAALRELVAAAPGHYDAHAILGYLLHTQGKLPEAAESYRRAIELDPGRADTHLNLGLVLDRLGDEDGAIQSFDTALEIDASKHQALIELARIYAGRHDLDRAFEYVVRLLENGAVTFEQIRADPELSVLAEDPRFEELRGLTRSP